MNGLREFAIQNPDAAVALGALAIMWMLSAITLALVGRSPE